MPKSRLSYLFCALLSGNITCVARGEAALLYGASGVMKVFLFDKVSEGVASFGALPREAWMTLGILELVCTVGQIVPAAFHWKPALTLGGRYAPGDREPRVTPQSRLFSASPLSPASYSHRRVSDGRLVGEAPPGDPLAGVLFGLGFANLPVVLGTILAGSYGAVGAIRGFAFASLIGLTGAAAFWVIALRGQDFRRHR